MKKNIKLIFYIILILLLCIFIFFILKNSFLYDYKDKLNDSLKSYYLQEDNDIESIKKIIDRYKTNNKKIDNINNILNEFILNSINEYNINYETREDLDNNYNKIISKITYLLDNINLDISSKKDSFISTIDNLYESKINYLEALKYYLENDYNKAYEYFDKVIKSDSYYDDINNKIDAIFNSELKIIEDKVNNEKIKLNDDNQNNLGIYTNILNILKEEKDNTIFDLEKSKTYINLLDETINKLLELYKNIAVNYAENNNYSEALKTINEGIKIITNMSYSAQDLINLKDEYDNMMPVLLTSLNEDINGNSLSEDIAVLDINNKSYPSAIIVKKNNNSSISYNLNKEYVKFKFTIAIGTEVNEKNKNYGRIKIYADNKVIYDSKDITKSFETKDISLNVKDINILKIEYTNSTSKSTSKSDILVALLGNPTLEKY